MGERASLATLASTQREILTALKLSHELGTEELAQRVYVTPGAVRHHLALLTNSGYVTYRTEGEGRGRPRFIYSLTLDGEALFPTAFEEFALRLLEEVRRAPGLPLEEVLCRVTQARLGTGEMPSGASRREALEALRAIFERGGYMPSTAENGSATLTLNHCPIRTAAQAERGLCAAEQAHMERLIGRPVERTAWRFAGDRICQFRIREPNGLH